MAQEKQKRKNVLSSRGVSIAYTIKIMSKSKKKNTPNNNIIYMFIYIYIQKPTHKFINEKILSSPNWTWPGHKDYKEKGPWKDQNPEAAALAQDAGARWGAVDAGHKELTEFHLRTTGWTTGRT